MKKIKQLPFCLSFMILGAMETRALSIAGFFKLDKMGDFVQFFHRLNFLFSLV